MKHIAGWFRRNNTLVAQAKDLQRQWQEMRDERDGWRIMYEGLSGTELYIRERLHSLARERDEERRLRLEAEQWARAVEGGAKKMLAFKRLLELEGSEEE